MREQAPTCLDSIRTLPALLGYVAGSFANAHAFNWREAGYWRHASTEEFCGEIRRLALGLHALGLKRGETVGILASPSPAWLIADLAILCAGGVSVPLFPNLSEENLAYESDNAALAYLIAIGEQPWRAAKPHAKRWRRVIVRGAPADEKHAIAWNTVLDLGDEASTRDPALYARLRDGAKGDDVATIIHTSGSTGKPKGVALTHENLLMQVRGAMARFPLDAANDKVLSCLPLAHVFERMVMYYYLAAGVAVWFADDIKKIGELLRDVRPTVTTMVPRLAEKLRARVVEGAYEKGGVGGAIGRWAMRRAERADARRGVGAVADKLVYGKVREALGGRLRLLIMGGAALATDLERFLRNVGLPLFVGYGLTEASPVLACNAPGMEREGTVGPVWPGVELKIGEHDEILAKGAGIMRGYHRDPEATAATIDRDGWLHTGDCGRFDADGYLTITGRRKELYKTSNGKYVSPVPIEQALVASGLIDQAMVVAEGKPYACALLFAAPDALAKARVRLGCTGMDDAAFATSDQLKRELDALVERVNASLDHWEQVRRWRLIPNAPSIERDELTPTLKLKRHVVQARYAELVAAMYAETKPEPAEAAPQGSHP